MYIKIEQIFTEHGLFTTSKTDLKMESDIHILQIYIYFYGRCTNGVMCRSHEGENHKLAICSNCSLNC